MDYSFTIIDSDASSALQLQAHMNQYANFHFANAALNTQDGLNHILKFLPEVVIINLNESASACFQMITELHQYLPSLPIFIAVANSKRFSYDAIKHGFFDYWVNPLNEFEIRKTIFRLQKYVPNDAVPTTLCLKTYRDYHYLDTNEILYLKADNNTTDFIMKDGSKISAFKTLKTFEQQLPDSFIRIHQSYILNVKYVSRINYGKSTCTIRNIERSLPFSKSYKESVDALKSLLSKNAINGAM